jgi:protein gp37
MAENTKISWATHTMNFWTGCSKQSPACANCYAETWAKRSGLVVWGDSGTRRRTSPQNWRKPYRWNELAKSSAERPRVFSNSLSDWAEARSELDEIRRDMWQVIRNCRNLDWLLLTKRADNIANCLPDDWGAGYPNVWLGVTAENQEWADKRIPELLSVPARVRFISAEPLLGSIEFSDVTRRSDSVSQLGKKAMNGIDWLIVGGESGPKHRPLNLDHVRSLRDQCVAAGVAFHFKQVGGIRPESGGCMLDGREWKEFPEVNV